MLTFNPRDNETVLHKKKLVGFEMVRNVRKDLTAALVIGNDAVIGVGRYKGTECRTYFDGQEGRKLFIRLEVTVLR